MPRVSGLGGYLTIDGTPDIRVDNMEYSYEADGVIDDTTSSDSTGWAQGTPVLKKLQSFDISIAEDSAAYVDALGLTPNATIDVWMKRGAAAKYDKATGTIVRSVRVVNNQQQVRRVQVSCEYGVLTWDVGAPA